jgi:predicted enzyme related to lactoylglutathione lyase
MIKHIAFTVYPVKDMARARSFYEGALGLKETNNFQDKWVEYILGNGCFAVTTMIPCSASGGVGIAFEVDDVDAACQAVKGKGAKVKMEPFATPGCRMAVIEDPDGHAVTLHKKNAGR